MRIKIKIASSHTVRKDRELATHPCEIIIRGTHNHNMQSIHGLQELRVTPDIKDTFFQYFELGKYSRPFLRHC